jgi:hypothetical protein
MSDLEALTARIAELEARLADTAPPPAPEPVLLRTPFVYEPPPTKQLAVIAADPSMRAFNVRQVRRFAVAVALSKGGPLPGAEVPSDYERPMRRLAECRAKGMNWRAALAACELAVPDDGDIEYQARQLRDGLVGLWDGTSDLLGRLERVLPNWVYMDLLKTLRPLL